MTVDPRFLLARDPFPVAVQPAVPRWVPLSPDQRTSGQARSLASGDAVPFVPRWETALEAALTSSGAVVVTPEWDSTDPDIVGTVRITVAPPGGPAWEREIIVPGWGLVVSTPGGIVQVDARIEVARRRWWVGVSPAFPRETLTPHEAITTVVAAATVDVDPPAYATRARLFVVSGSVAFPSPLSTPVVSPAELVCPATRVSITGIAAVSEFLLQWEVIS